MSGLWENAVSKCKCFNEIWQGQYTMGSVPRCGIQEIFVIITVMLGETWQTNRIFSKGMRKIKEWEGWTSWENWRDGIQRTIGGNWSWIWGNSTSFVTGRKEEVGGDRSQFVDMAAYFEFPFLEMDLNLLFLFFLIFYFFFYLSLNCLKEFR